MKTSPSSEHPFGTADPVLPPSIRLAADWLGDEISAAAASNDLPGMLRFARDRAYILFSYYLDAGPAFIATIRIENLFLLDDRIIILGDPPRAVPALATRFCPVQALRAWIELANLTSGPLFRRVRKSGGIADAGLSAGDLVGVFRQALADAKLHSS